MADLPRQSPTVSVQAGQGQVPYLYQMNVGSELSQAAAAAGNGANALADFRKSEQILAGQNAAVDEHVQLLGKIQKANIDFPDPQDRQAALTDIAKYYTSSEYQKTQQDTLGRHGSLAFRQSFMPQMLDTVVKEYGKAEQARQNIYIGTVHSTAEKAMRDAVSSGYGTPDFDKGMLKAQGIYELADKSLIPDAALQQNKLVDRAYAAVAEHQAGIDPRGVLDQIAKTGKLKYTINGNEGDAIADPQLAQHIKNVAIQALNFNQSQADHTTRLDLARIKAEGDQVEAGATLGIINGEPNAMRAAVESVDTVHKRVLLDGSAQRSLYNFKLAVDKERAEGPSVSDPVAYGKAVSDIENLRVTNPLSVMTLPLLTFNDRARLTTSMMSLQHKMKDDEYAAHRIKRKEGEDTLRADLKAKDPSTAWGEVNPKAEILVTQYRQRLDSEEARVRATGGKGWNTLNPLKTATEVMNENAETIAKDFRQGATKIIGTLGQFVPPPGTQVTYKRMHDNIEKSPLLPNEKLMFHALTNQMYAQGITAEKIDSTIRGADIKDETQQANWLMRLYQGMTQSAQP